MSEQELSKEKLDIAKNSVERIIKWYENEKRNLPWREDTNPYHVWISEIMLQQTRVEAVIPYYKRFLEKLPSVFDLAIVDDDELMKLWQGLGYYNRARNLKKGAQYIVKERDGVFPCTYDELLLIPGIGSYTAGAIASICFSQPVAAVDGNVLRVFSRLLMSDMPIDKEKTKKYFFKELSCIYPEENLTSSFTQGIMDLGAMVCIPNGMPLCEKCPLFSICLAHQASEVLSYPKKSMKKDKKEVNKIVYILNCNGRYAVNKRPDHGLLASLYEFPNVDKEFSDQESIHYIEEQGLKITKIHKMIRSQHIFTHMKWHMKGYYMECEEMYPEYEWYTIQELEEKIAIPSAFMIFLDAIDR